MDSPWAIISACVCVSIRVLRRGGFGLMERAVVYNLCFEAHIVQRRYAEGAASSRGWLSRT